MTRLFAGMQQQQQPLKNDAHHDESNNNSIMASTSSNTTIPLSPDAIRLLLRLNVAAYPNCDEKRAHGYPCPDDGDIMEEILKRGHSLFGQRADHSMSSEQASMQAWEEDNWGVLLNGTVYPNLTYTSRSIPAEHAKYDYGVSASEWTLVEENDDNSQDNTGTPSTTTILVFRGTFSPGDYVNMESWMLDFLLEKSTGRMKRAWTEDAGLEWTAEMEQRNSHDDTLDKLELRAVQQLKPQTTKLTNELQQAVDRNKTLKAALLLRASQNSIDTKIQEPRMMMNYWEITKYIVDQVYHETLSKNQTLILTGHSQGGTRAQLASMYLQQKYGVIIPTISFAATGAACTARHWSASLLNDVNPFIRHDQMVEVVHPLDPWGSSMLGEDNGGKVCYFGTSRFQPVNTQTQHHGQDPALEYCSRIYGYPGATLVVNEHNPHPFHNDALRLAFRQCRYFTHTIHAMWMALSDDEVLLALKDRTASTISATTDGGCNTVPIIPKDDPNQVCPTGNLSPAEQRGIAFLSVVVVVIIMMVCSCGAHCLLFSQWRGWRKQCYQQQRQPRSSRNDGDDEYYHDEENTNVLVLPLRNCFEEDRKEK